MTVETVNIPASKTDVYEINETDISTQKETTWENIVEYFESYVKPFQAYKDEPTYKAIISFFVQYYLNEIYNVQPELFKELFENQTIRSELVDLLLVSIGLPEKVIRTITTTSKFIILKSFSDFERYKGTVKFFRSIGGAFTDVMSYYELFIDYDETYLNPAAEYLIFIDKDFINPGSYFLISSTLNSYYVWFNYDDSNEDPLIEDRIGIEIKYNEFSVSSGITRDIIKSLNETNEFYVNVNSIDILEIQTSKHGVVLAPPSSGTTSLEIRVVTEGKAPGAWILRPRPVYVHSKTKLVTEVFSYQAAYNKIPTLLVPEEQLNELKASNNIILPTKSNIILMDYTQLIDASYFNTLIFTILMENIGDDYFSVYLTGSDGTTAITYNTAIFLWYYLLAKYYNVTLEGVDLALHIVMGTRKITDYTISDIPIIQEAYDKIKTRKQLTDFYQEYITDHFVRIYDADKPTISSMSETLRKLNPDFWEYIENRISAAENIEQDIRFLLDELYASMVLSFEHYRTNSTIYKYIPILLQFVTSITTNIKATDSYKIVYNLKPFHTELLDLAHNKIEINDKFNALLFDDSYSILYLLGLADILHLADETFFSFIPKDSTSLSLNDGAIPNVKLFYNFDISQSDEWKSLFLKTILNFIQLSDHTNFFFSPKEKETILSLIDNGLLNLRLIKKDNNEIKMSFYNLILKLILNIVHLSDQSSFLFTPKEKETVLTIVDKNIAKLNLSNINELELKDQIKNLIFNSITDFINISDKNTFLFSPEEKETMVNIIDNCLSNFQLNFQDSENIKQSIYILLLKTINNYIQLSDQTKFIFSPEEKETIIKILDNSINRIKLSFQFKNVIDDKFFNKNKKDILENLSFLNKQNYFFAPNLNGNNLNFVSKISVKHIFSNTGDSKLSWADNIEIK